MILSCLACLIQGKIKLKDATMEESKNSFLAKEMDMLKRIEELQKNTGGYRASLDEGKGQEVRPAFYIQTCFNCILVLAIWIDSFF